MQLEDEITIAMHGKLIDKIERARCKQEAVMLTLPSAKAESVSSSWSSSARELNVRRAIVGTYHRRMSDGGRTTAACQTYMQFVMKKGTE